MFLTALVTMPFALTTRPSLQVGLLAEIARSNGLPVDTLHLNLDLARLIGADRYHHLACTRNPMVGDWLFSLDAFGGDAPDPAGAMLEDLGAATQETLDLIAMSAAELRHVREAVVPAYLDGLVAEIAWEKYSVVAFTSTFQQNVASFALARRLKALRPDIVIVFGGANFDGPMGLAWMQAVPQIDFAISGEADRSFPALLNRLASGSDPTDVPGLLWRRDGEARTGAPAVPFDVLDDLPVPNYGEYFERSLELGLLTPDTIRTVDVPFESSRGCWWGAKATCRFCGLNGSTMTYRSKSPGKVMAELAIQAERYGSLSFNASDNIMNVDLLRSMMQPLAEASIDYRLFYEVKADLSRQDIRLMSQAGVRALQPGIESLSSHLLRLMRKGTRAATNVNLLRWTRYYGVDAHWNLLYGFPGETAEDYDAQQELVKRIPHLSPPGGFLRIGLERFSPYFEESERFPVRGGRATPEPGYSHTYPAYVDLFHAAYHFAGELEGSLCDESYRPLSRSLQAWNERWQAGDRPELTFWWAPGVLHIEDQRSSLSPGSYRFQDPAAGIYAASSDAPITVAALAKRCDRSIEEVSSIVAEFEGLGLAMRDGQLVLALALPGSPGR